MVCGRARLQPCRQRHKRVAALAAEGGHLTQNRPSEGVSLGELFVAAGPVSRILSVPASRGGTAIPLGRALLHGSSDLPGGLTHRAGTCPTVALSCETRASSRELRAASNLNSDVLAAQRSWLKAHRSKLPATAGLPPYLVLLRVGFALPAALLPRRCALTAPFHPYPGAVAEALSS